MTVHDPEFYRLEVFLVRPTKYDDDGYLLRHARGVLPSNTLACLHTLTEDVRRRCVLGKVELRVHLCDESVQALPARRILWAARRRRTRTVLCLVGVQTSQFPRAAELARRFRARGVTVLIGGFHVSGTLAMLPETPRDLRALIEAGVTLVNGEIDATWGGVLRDAAAGTLAPLYDFTGDKPDLSVAPVPRLEPHLMRRFVYRHFGTLDAGRGCPFACSFCTIINVQGRAMRCRDAATVADAILTNYRLTGTCHYFFTDDNFARNPNWRAIFEALIGLRERRGIPLRFLMQVDLLSHRIPDFIALAARAGCFQVFLGMESLNPASLADGGKHQNRVANYADLIEAWHGAGILTHVGYIIGFPHDTPASVRDDLRRLRDDVGPDLASFFMLSPLPGSADHLRLTTAGVAMDADWNRYDTFHPVIDHPQMSRATWLALYEEAWRDFYASANLERRLARAPRAQHVTLLQLYLWYRTATEVERFHPMMTGFFRLKPRTDRRPGCRVEGRARHLRRRGGETWAMLRGYARVLAELQHLWVATRGEHTAVEFSRHAFEPCTGAAVVGDPSEADTQAGAMHDRSEPHRDDAVAPEPSAAAEQVAAALDPPGKVHELATRLRLWAAFLRAMFIAAEPQLNGPGPTTRRGVQESPRAPSYVDFGDAAAGEYVALADTAVLGTRHSTTNASATAARQA
ncbi:MAG: radical SAM protein [Deltaproteobacteria bacterium]|nr:radical SAM protein [Deltaproteobacteria bacterium]